MPTTCFNPLHCGAVVASSWKRPPMRRFAPSFNPLHCGAVVASRQRRRVDAPPPRVSIPFIAGQWSLLRRAVHCRRRRHCVSIPFIAGQWSLQRALPALDPERAQVSIPFIAGQWSLRFPGRSATSWTPCFNPLHCGAVVASERLPPRRGGRAVFQSPSLRGSGRFRSAVHLPGAQRRVSIPFIAGQWSLHVPTTSILAAGDLFQSPSLRGSGRFSYASSSTRWKRRCVSIPFIAGQWSLLAAPVPGSVDDVVFQSPSLRGSGRFWSLNRAPKWAKDEVSIPFIAGQWSLLFGSGWQPNPLDRVSIPFIAGQWSLPAPPGAQPRPRARVSIPFIAGQWSLPSGARRTGRSRRCFNPLHCGAVVASASRRRTARGALRVSIPFIAGQWSLPEERAQREAAATSFNPLHCGAVVASARRDAERRAARSGFNPLHCGAVVASGRNDADPPPHGGFQSPSLRGSGRFVHAPVRFPGLRDVSIPFIAGQWSLRRNAFPPEGGASRVSIPFIAGQWSLPGAVGAAPRPPRRAFQSPSLRGSGRFRRGGKGEKKWRLFQSPSLRGSGRFSACPRPVSGTLRRFNPLHCGAVVASREAADRARAQERVSIPFIAGQWSLHIAWSRTSFPNSLVSIPFIAGQWSLLPRTTPLSFCGVLLRKRRLPCDHIICTRLPF